MLQSVSVIAKYVWHVSSFNTILYIGKLIKSYWIMFKNFRTFKQNCSKRWKFHIFRPICAFKLIFFLAWFVLVCYSNCKTLPKITEDLAKEVIKLGRIFDFFIFVFFLNKIFCILAFMIQFQNSNNASNETDFTKSGFIVK